MNGEWPNLPRFADLRGVSTTLGDDEPYRRLKTSINKAVRVQSCVSDIAQSLNCVEALEALLQSPRKQGTVQRASTETALLATAVQLYARGAGDSRSKGERGPISIAGELTAGQLGDHQHILDVRHRALAHVYNNERIADATWHEDAVLLVETEEGWQPIVASHRVQVHEPTIQALHRQLPVADQILRRRFHSHLSKAIDLLNEAPTSNVVLERNLVDPVQIFGSLERVRKVLKDRAAGRSTIVQ